LIYYIEGGTQATGFQNRGIQEDIWT